MKKLLSCLLALTAAISLSACGAPDEVPEQNAAGSSVPPAAVSETETPPEPEKPAEEKAPPEEEAPAQTEAPDGLRPEFKAAMDSYEAFYDGYCAFMKKYAENPGDLEMLGEYAGMLEQLADMDEAFSAWESEDLNEEELAYYLEVSSRVMQKLLDAAE